MDESQLAVPDSEYFSKIFKEDRERVSGLQVFAAEASGPTHDKVHPRIGITAKWIWSIYAGITALLVNEWFNDLRLRASYATIGNSALGSDYPYLGTYGAKLVGPMAGIAWNVMGNNNLKWETTETFDIGLDGALFNNRTPPLRCGRA